jgi:hypothetical protein
MRFAAAVLMNVIVPGAGLLLVGRVELGIATSVLFAFCAEAAFCGMLIAPAAMPPWLTVGAGSLAMAIWVVAQWLLRDRLATLRDPELQKELEAIRAEVVAAIQRKDLLEARGLLQIALRTDPDSVETQVLWARLMTLLGRFSHSRRAWRRILKTGDDRFAREAAEAMEQLPAK